MEGNDRRPMRLHLSVKEKWYRQIASGEKANEYRDVSPYYDDRLLTAPPKAEKPNNSEGWTRCSDGKWRKFRPSGSVVFHLSGSGKGEGMEVPLRAVDCEGGKYVLRLGKA